MCVYPCIHNTDVATEFECDLGDIPHTPSSLVHVANPIVPFNDLSEDDLEDLYAQMNGLTKGIQLEFLSLLTQVHESFKKSVDLDALVLVLKRDDVLVFEEHDPELASAKDISQVFHVIRPHCSYFNFEMLQTIIRLLGSKHDKQILEKYIQAFSNYCKAMPCAEKICGTAQANSKRTKLIFKLQFNREEFKTDQMQSIKITIAHHLRIQTSSLYLRHITEGCVELEFLVPTFLCKRIFPLTDAQKAALFYSVKVVSVECGQLYSAVCIVSSISVV